MTNCTNRTTLSVNGQPAGGGGGGAGDTTLFSGTFSTNGAEVHDVPLFDLAVDGAWVMLWDLTVGGTTQANGIGIAAYGGIIWGMGEATALRNNSGVGVPQFYGSQFGAAFPRNQGYTQPAVYGGAGIPANIVFVANVAILRVTDASGFAWDWSFRGHMSMNRGAIRLIA